MLSFSCIIKNRNIVQVSGLKLLLKNKIDIHVFVDQRHHHHHHHLLEEQHENFVAAVRKWEMLAATKVKMSGSEKKKKVNENTYDISSIKTCNYQVSGRFYIVVVQNNGKEMYKKSVLHLQSCFFAN